MNISPMLACHGGFTLSPELQLLLLSVALTWLGGVLAVIPNAVMSYREAKKTENGWLNFVFLALYVCVGCVLWSGAVAHDEMLLILVLLVPLMSLGHFVFLFIKRQMDRKARRLAENAVNDAPPATETMVEKSSVRNS